MPFWGKSKGQLERERLEAEQQASQKREEEAKERAELDELDKVINKIRRLSPKWEYDTHNYLSLPVEFYERHSLKTVVGDLTIHLEGSEKSWVSERGMGSHPPGYRIYIGKYRIRVESGRFTIYDKNLQHQSGYYWEKPLADPSLLFTKLREYFLSELRPVQQAAIRKAEEEKARHTDTFKKRRDDFFNS